MAGAAGRVGGSIFQQVGGRSSMSRNTSRCKPTSQPTHSRMANLRLIGFLWRAIQDLLTYYNVLTNPFVFPLLSSFTAFRNSITYLPDRILFRTVAPNIYSGIYFNFILPPSVDYRFLVRPRISDFNLVTHFELLVRDNPSSTILFEKSFFPPFVSSDYYIDFVTPKTNLRFFIRFHAADSTYSFQYVALCPLPLRYTESWESAAVNFPSLNRFAESRRTSGYELFSKLNLNLLGLNLDPVLSAPVKSDLPALQIQSATASQVHINIRYSVETLPANYAVMLLFSRCVPRSVSYCKESWLKQYRGPVILFAFAFDAFTPFTSLFGQGSLIAGSHFFCRSQVFDTRSGERLISETVPINVS